MLIAFHLCRAVFSDTLVIEGADGAPLDVGLDHIYSGTLEDDPNARVYGSINEHGIFEGKIYTKDGTYYVERASRYPNASDPDGTESAHSVIYLSEDVSHPYLDTLGSGCGQGSKEAHVRKWMEEVSNSVSEEQGEVESHKREKRSPLDRTNLFDGIPTIPSFSFSSNNQNRRDSGRPEGEWRNQSP